MRLANVIVGDRVVLAGHGEQGFVDLEELPPARNGRLYDWAYHHDLLIGSGVNVAGLRPAASR